MGFGKVGLGCGRYCERGDLEAGCIDGVCGFMIRRLRVGDRKCDGRSEVMVDRKRCVK